MSDCSLFTGAERLETVEALGRPMRAGHLDALAVSDAARFRNLLGAHERHAARQLLDLMHTLNGFMLDVGVELALRWPQFVQGRLGKEEAPKLTQQVFARWETAANRPGHLQEDGGTAFEVLRIQLNPQRIMPPAVEEFLRQKQEGQPNVVSEIFAEPEVACRRMREHLDAERFDIAKDEFNAYQLACRVRHDLVIQMLWEWGVVARERFGPRLATEAFHAAFSRCSCFEGMWSLFGSLPPAQRAAFLAEHLRAHFSGLGREGSVRIVEEADRYRLVLDPCGSGGAIRRSLAGTQELAEALLPEAMPATWGRAGEVPAYCAHCALNEIESIKRFGHPLWVTEFDPDPARPCGWTVFKDPSKIPARYFQRTGAEYDSRYLD